MGTPSGSRSSSGSPLREDSGLEITEEGMAWRLETRATFVIRPPKPSTTSSPSALSRGTTSFRPCTGHYPHRPWPHFRAGVASGQRSRDSSRQVWTRSSPSSPGRCARSATHGASVILQPLLLIIKAEASQWILAGATNLAELLQGMG